MCKAIYGNNEMLLNYGPEVFHEILETILTKGSEIV